MKKKPTKKANLLQFREAQRRIIEDYKGGLMAVSAVPGSGKTFTLAHLAARLVQDLLTKYEAQGQEILIVTFSNSAVNGFKKRINDILQYERKLLPYVGYRVRTLHGLAHDIVRERPSLVGLADDFQIIDDRTSAEIRRDIVRSHLPQWRDMMSSYVTQSLSERQLNSIYAYDFAELMIAVVDRYISHAKDNEITPDIIEEHLENAEQPFELVRFANTVYTDYQRSLAFRGAVDFSDLVRLALMALDLDPAFLQRLRERWVYILEDEAQDSSFLQEKMLGLLSGGRNWVRVGDPNQAINSTFTTASPRFLMEFMQDASVQSRPLPVSGRSSRKIISLANELLRWTVEEHPVEELHDAFFPQNIQPTESGDSQPNPPDKASNIHVHYQTDQLVTPEQELELVVRSLERYLAENPNKTVAVLVPENSRGFKLVEHLRQEGLPYEELLRSSSDTRQVAAMLRSVLMYLAVPYDPAALAKLYRDLWWSMTLGEDETQNVMIPYQAINRVRSIESLIYPLEDASLGEILNLPEENEHELLLKNISDFLVFVRRWLAALSLPIDQLALTVSQDLFTSAADTALSYRLAVMLRSFANEHPDWSISQFAEELRVISENERRFIGFDDAISGFEPTPGKVTVSTMHAAKGLEWDRVYLMALNNYSFPSMLNTDDYAGQKWFIRDNLNLEAVALTQFYALIDGKSYNELAANRDAFYDNARERLRLLYVAITRARSDVIMTWNAGRVWRQGVTSTLAMPGVHTYLWLEARKV